ncbi:RHS repeat domain-containing protein [Pandoraea anapnoica]|uniref:RHS repeat domain-containing protein n=1 Tax=Pandoraea anapnoica TaxID=2508301 RepID=UPI0015832AA0|nr:RHS repeat protein [Pandoraea anapnoica]
MLENITYETCWQHDATDALLAQTDAVGNTQRHVYTVDATLCGSTWQTPGGEATALITHATADARGRIVAQTLGNGVTENTLFDTASERLLRRVCQTADGATLQDLAYDYDPVGNVVRITNAMAPVQFWRNRRIDGTQTYVYDSLYQLIEATGRESATLPPSPALPDWIPVPDATRTTPYTQTFSYDAGGNLVEVAHTSDTRGQSWKQRFAVSHMSNRSVLWESGLPEPDVEASFDLCGNLLALTTGQPIRWSAANRLAAVTFMTHDDGSADEERYVYDAQGDRVRKVGKRLAASTTHVRETRYLHGLELRRDTATGEVMHVAMLDAGRTRVQVYVWETGLPARVENHQVRYILADHLESATVEIDAKAEVISRESYYAFGGTAWRAAASEIAAGYRTIRYAGHEQDATGLNYHGQRYHAPWLHRWLNPDPAGNVDGLNRYRFVVNNPLTLADRDGQQAVSIVYGMDDVRIPYLEAYNRVHQPGGLVRFRINEFNEALGIRGRGALKKIQKGIEVRRKHVKRLMRHLPHLNTQTAASLLQRWSTHLHSRAEELSLHHRFRNFTEDERFAHLQKMVKKNLSLNSGGRLWHVGGRGRADMRLRHHAHDLRDREIRKPLEGDVLDSALENAFHNAFFRRLSKIGLEWAQLEGPERVPVEFLVYSRDANGRHRNFDDIGPMPSAQAHGAWMTTSVDDAGQNFFPITMSEYRTVRKLAMTVQVIRAPVEL